MPSFGARGEVVAARHLRENGFNILKRNYKCPAGEVDIIAREGETVVFVEVKARSGTGFGLPCEAVDRRKQERLIRIAHHYLSRLDEQPPARFDVVSVMRKSDRTYRIEHIRDAFGMGGLL